MPKIAFALAVEKIETRSDRTIKIVIGTSREMSAEAKTALFSIADKNAFGVFSTDDDITESDIPLGKPDPMIKSKSESQRLRNTLFVLFKQRGAEGTFESYYKQQMERIIDRFKEELEGVA
ncbi:MAG: hypothetical protein WCJ60_02240 [bacterium]